ncbi:MAG: homoserine dehydrogenase [Firmicutes bacterium]|nr:homoserine dehydrogenase [Bacillota bacterium]
MNIAIIGYGVVGGGVYALLRDGALGIYVRRVMDLLPIAGLEDGLFTDNIADIISDPAIDCVVEAVGGLHPALSHVTAALRAGKHVVTSNKELISHALAPLKEGAAMHRAQLRFSASVGGGVPWLHNLLRQKRGDTLLSVHGIVNGTTNYILDAMGNGMDLSAALKDAQRMGYSEADASADLDGLDTKRKCAISAALAFDAIVEADSVPTLGISAVRKIDIDTFAQHGLTCKLMMYAERGDASLCAYVEPSLLARDTLAAHTPAHYNCITLCGVQSGALSFFGQGAGRHPTAENIVQDLLDIATHATYKDPFLKPVPVDNDMERHPYYIRTSRKELLSGIDGEDWNGALLTKPMAVTALHALAKAIREKDPDAFFAGVPGYDELCHERSGKV